MLRTNLSTRPFYNERIAFLALGGAALVVAALTVFNVFELVSLSARDRALTARINTTEQEVVRFQEQARLARARVDRKALETVVAAAREANGLIDVRTFSWTELLNRLETTLPADVRIESIKPVPSKEGPLELRLVVLARRAEDVDAFVDELEKRAGFRDVVSESETTTAEGLLEVTLQGQYFR
jgi:Tfp pilus assembly protein PilN